MEELNTSPNETFLDYIEYLDIFENNFQQNINDFFNLESRKCLILETKDTRVGAWRIRDVLLQIEDNLSSKYRGTDNQAFLTWSDLISVMTPSKLLPKFQNLVVIEITEADLESESLYIIGNILDRLNFAIWRKVIFITYQAEALDNFLSRMVANTFIKLNEFEDKISSTIDDAEEEPLLKSAAAGDLQSVKELLKCNSCFINKALYLAVERRHKDVVMFLIQHGADVNAIQCGTDPLELAAWRGYEDIVLILTENGANMRSNNGLIHAARQGNYNIVVTLIECDADVNVQNDDGASALHLAAQNGHYVIVYTLLKHGANVNSQDSSGYTALHFAALYGYSDIVGILLSMNTCIDLQARDGKTPLDLAKEYGHREIIQQFNDYLEERDVLRQAISIIKRKSQVIVN